MIASNNRRERPSLSRVARAIWSIATEAALAVGLTTSGWRVAVLCSLGWAAVSAFRGYRDEVSKSRPQTAIHTTIAALVAGAIAIRDARTAATLTLGYVPIVGAMGAWGIYAANRRRALETLADLEAGTFERRHASLAHEESAIAGAERRLRERLRAAWSETASFLALEIAAKSYERMFASYDALNRELRSTTAKEVDNVAPASAAPEVDATVFAAWYRRVRAHITRIRAELKHDTLLGGVAWLVMIAVGAWIPATRASVDLVPWVTLICGVGAVPFVQLIERRAVATGTRFGFLATMTWNISLMHIACAALVACSSPAGAVMYAAQYSAAISGHAFHLRATLRAPWGLVPIVIGYAVGLFLARGDAQRGVLTATFVLTLPVAFVAGRLAWGMDDVADATTRARHRAELEREREIRERIGALSSLLRGLFDVAHQASSPLLAARLIAHQLDGGADDPSLLPRLRTYLETVEQRLSRALDA